jgi:predicted RNA polymerase sigma factor
MDALAATLKAAYPRALATLIRVLQDIDAAEDAVQEAITCALEVWPGDGIPNNPVAWLVTAGRNKAIDLHRRHKLEARYRESLLALADDHHFSIAASEAARAEDTDWRQIAELYRVLERYQPSPVVTLNRAVAVAKVQGAKAGLALLRTIETAPEIRRYHHFHAALAALLVEDNQLCSAIATYEKALALTQNPSERAFIRRKISSLT